MNVTEILRENTSGGQRFSFEVLPPLKGNGTGALFNTIDKLKEYNPLFINITTHHSEYVYKELENGQFERQRIRRRPGTIAMAASIQNRYGIPVIPHIIYRIRADRLAVPRYLQPVTAAWGQGEG